MKKTYFAPEIQVMDVEISPIMDASGPTGALVTDEDSSIMSSDGFGSRRGSLWDDDEE